MAEKAARGIIKAATRHGYPNVTGIELETCSGLPLGILIGVLIASGSPIEDYCRARGVEITVDLRQGCEVGGVVVHIGPVEQPEPSVEPDFAEWMRHAA